MHNAHAETNCEVVGTEWKRNDRRSCSAAGDVFISENRLMVIDNKNFYGINNGSKSNANINFVSYT